MLSWWWWSIWLYPYLQTVFVAHCQEGVDTEVIMSKVYAGDFLAQRMGHHGFVASKAKVHGLRAKGLPVISLTFILVLLEIKEYSWGKSLAVCVQVSWFWTTVPMTKYAVGILTYQPSCNNPSSWVPYKANQPIKCKCPYLRPACEAARQPPRHYTGIFLHL